MEKRELALVMTFKNQDGKESVVTLKQVREDITEAEVSATMDLIVSTNIFGSSGGNLVSKVKAQVVDKNVVELEVA